MTDLPQAYHGHPYDAEHVKARAAFDHDKGEVVVEAEFTTQYFVLDPYVMPMTYKGALQLRNALDAALNDARTAERTLAQETSS